ncbi:H+/gluconate symporter [Eubacterium oxidoreducens]|uniref:H+/gluconate symporter n=2 Tax=Eubacterium oxidoreducens TaxID=1732 RepID=A0A1G6AUM2_EUBOX|nr:H+/gluconate symporter [Eubacterium oxidoreducens]
MLSLVGIFVGLALMIFLAYKGHSIIWVAPLCAFVVVLFSCAAGLGEDRTLLSSYTVDYMQGVGEYFISWFPTFLLGAIYGKVMDITGAASSLAKVIVRLVGTRMAVLAVLIPCMLLTYGGVSLFVVVFIMYPMGYEIYKAADIPRHMLPAVIAFGAMGITMTCIPGTPQIQNLIPMDYYGTDATAAPVLGIVAALLIGIPGYLYLNRRVKSAKKSGKHFEPDPQMSIANEDEKKPSWHWLSGLVPLIVVFVTLNILDLNIVIALILGIICCFLFNMNMMKEVPHALTEGAKGSVTAMMNTACAVGFGSVIKIVPGFVLLTGLLIGSTSNPVSLLLSEALATGVLSGATGSASGGLSIALSAFADNYLAMADNLGISPQLLHRIGAIAAGALDKLPHNGAIITLLAVSHCTHKESYKDIFVTSVVIPVLATIILVVVWGIAM